MKVSKFLQIKVFSASIFKLGFWNLSTVGEIPKIAKMSKIHSISFLFGKIGNSKAYSIGGSKVVSLKCLRYWFYFKSDKFE